MKYLILCYIIVIICLLTYSESLPLKHEEPRRAIISQEMLFTGDFIIPKICQEPYYKKPPFQNWVIALASLKDRYISNLDARLPSLISLILMSFFVFLLLKEYSLENAIISSIIALTSFSTMISYGIKAEPDMLFAFLFFMAYYFFIKDRIFLSSLFMGASILTKGISPVFFYPAFLIFAFFQENRLKFYKKLIYHLILSLILPLIWIILYYFNGNLENLIKHMFFEVKDRTVSNFKDIFLDAIFFPFRAFLALFPWSIFIFYFKKKNFVNNKIILSSIIVFAVIFFILFIFPCGKGRYFLPAVPFFAIIAGYFADYNRRINFKLAKILSLFSFFLCVAGSLFFIYKLYIFHSLIIFFTGLLLFILFRVSITIKELCYVITLGILLISTYFFNFYRTKYMYNYQKDAKIIISKIKEYNLPVVVGYDYNKLRLLFNLEREYQRPLYRDKRIFRKYIFLTTKKQKRYKQIFVKKVKNRLIYFYLVNQS